MNISNRNKMLDTAAVTRSNPVFDDMTPNFLFGNGLFGGCVDAFGMADTVTGTHQAYLWHQFHVELGRDSRECRVPLLLQRYRIYSDGKEAVISPETVCNYKQTLSIRQGLIKTEYTLKSDGEGIANIVIAQYVSFELPRHIAWEMTVEPKDKPLSLEFQVEMLDSCISQNNVPISYPVTSSLLDGVPILTSTTSRGKTHCVLADVNKRVNIQDKVLSLRYDINEKTTVTPRAILLNERENRSLNEAIGGICTQSASVLKQAHIDSWRSFWGKSFIDPANQDLFSIWARFLYCLRSSQGETKSVPISPGGLASNTLWPFEFPQDYLWIYESFFGANHLELASTTANYWAGVLEQARTFTKNNLHVNGVFFPWMMSHFDNSEQSLPGYDCPWPYQLHNAAYPLRMCYLYWRFTGDDGYLKSVLPVAEGVADFYTAISTYISDSQKYEIHFKPCMGQDEYGAFNSNNYLCCMLSAAYSIKIANEMYRAAGQTPKQEWVDIENIGYAFEKLESNGLLATYEGGPAPNPQQKHPSQLNALASLPLLEVYKSEEFKNTYLRRYEISLDSDKNAWSGWSLGTFLLASVRMGDPKECQKDFDMMLKNRDSDMPQFDKDNFQMIESSKFDVGSSYFHTAMAMVVTAITELFVQSFNGICKVFPVVLPSLEEKPLSFENLLTPFGCTLSGKLENGVAEITLCVMRNTNFTLQLGSACVGQYVLVDSNGNFLQKSANGTFNLSLDVGDYTICQNI